MGLSGYLMDAFNSCWVTLLAEKNQFQVPFDHNTFTVTNSDDEPFNKPHKRIGYLYKYGTFDIVLLQCCFIDFMKKSHHAPQILDRICFTENLNLCSLGIGPGLDVIGFLSSFNQLGKPLRYPVNFQVVRKHGSWQDLLYKMVSYVSALFPTSSSCKLNHCDILETLSRKVRNCLKNANIVIMYQPFTAVEATKEIISSVLKSILHLLKPGTLVFFISDKEKSACFTEICCKVPPIYGPSKVQVAYVPYNRKIAELVGFEPVCSGNAYFTVWQKSDLDVEQTFISSIKEAKINNQANLNIVKLKENIRIGPGLLSGECHSSIANKMLHNNLTSAASASETSQGTDMSSKDSDTSLQLVNKTFLVKNKIESAKQTKSEPSLGALLCNSKRLVSALENYIALYDPLKHTSKHEQNYMGNSCETKACDDEKMSSSSCTNTQALDESKQIKSELSLSSLLYNFERLASAVENYTTLHNPSKNCQTFKYINNCNCSCHKKNNSSFINEGAPTKHVGKLSRSEPSLSSFLHNFERLASALELYLTLKHP